MRLTRRLALIIIAAMVPLVAVELFNAYALIRGEQEKSRALAIQYARAGAFELQRVISGVQGLLTTIRHSPMIKQGEWSRCGDFLGGLVPELPEIRGILIADVSGAVVCSTTGIGGFSLADRPYFRRALAGESFVIGSYVVGRGTGRAILPVAAPIRDQNDKLIGVAVASLNLDWLSEALRARGIPRDGSLTVADETGTIIARQPFPEKFIGTQIPDRYRYLLAESGFGAIEVVSQDGTTRILGYKPVATDPAGLYVSAGLSVDEAYSGVYAAGYRLVIAGIIALVAAIALAVAIGSRFVTRPMARLIGAAEQWRAGDMTARTGLTGSDEFGTIGAQLDRAMDQAERREKRISLLMNELSHRVKNQMALIMSIAQLSGKSAADVGEFKTGFYNRLIAMSRSHDLVFKLKEEHALLGDLVKLQLEHLTNRDKVLATGPAVWLASEAVQYLGMALHELATNAVKYGALSRPDGRIEITWSLTGDAGAPRLEITWEEIDGPTVVTPLRSGFGSTILTKAIPAGLKGQAKLDFAPAGLTWRCSIAAAIVTEPEPL
jgi:two-component sensor histidine kinase